MPTGQRRSTTSKVVGNQGRGAKAGDATGPGHFRLDTLDWDDAARAHQRHPRAHAVFELLEEIALDAGVLVHRLDDQIGVLESDPVACDSNGLLNSSRFGAADVAPADEGFHQSGQSVPDPSAAEIAVANHDLVSKAGEAPCEERGQFARAGDADSPRQRRDRIDRLRNDLDRRRRLAMQVKQGPCRFGRCQARERGPLGGESLGFRRAPTNNRRQDFVFSGAGVAWTARVAPA